ncbi:MAG: CRISPR-associated protein Csh1 [Thermosediminibacterales bacterium]|nr:CRISPR-associated protein Csh1 [Thermosediminibacterales bacterium]MDK2835978.1 CRISPR-associated protein Csh1 [Thermosediminibacterales bacterium]
MLSAVKEVGKLVIEREGRSLLDVLIENPNSNGSYKKVIAIVLEQKNGQVRFAGVEQEDYEEAKVARYLYRKGAARGADITPTARITDKPEFTFDMKILGWFGILDEKKLDISKEKRDLLGGIRNELKKNGDFIKKEILRIRQETPKRDNLIVTLKIKQDNELKYVGDFEVFKKLLLAKVNEKDMRNSERNKICSLCGERKDVIFGKIDTYAFYTLDKPGYITGGFDEKKAWRNFPVCPECKVALEEGKKFIENNLTFKFCGIQYNLIPKFIVGKEAVSDEILDIFSDTSKIFSLKERVIRKIADDEEEILDVLKDAKDTLTLNFLFLQKMNSAERILLLIEDVFPSRLRRIFEAKEYVDGVYGENFTFKNIRNFFSKSDSNKRNFDLDGYFLDITDRIFKVRPVDYGFLMQFIMKRVRDDFINDRYFYSAVKNGLMVLTFLENLDLIKMEEEKMEERIFDGLFRKYGPAFETPLKRGLFLLGSLTELLLRKQYKEREAKPFMKNLKSLKMTEKDFKGLLPKIQNKLEEYDSFDRGKRTLAAEAANYLLQAGDNWKMTVDEMNFYFASGMDLVDEVAKIIYPDREHSGELI